MGGQGQGEGCLLPIQGTRTGPESTLQPIQLYLSNPHNLCYSNATFIGLHWTGRCLNASASHEPSTTLGRLLPPRSSLQRGTHNRPLYTPNLLGFQLIFQGFPRVGEQHDTCEFLHHCLVLLEQLRDGIDGRLGLEDPVIIPYITPFKDPDRCQRL